MEIEDRVERARTFIGTVGRRFTDDAFEAAVADYLRQGGGDRDDPGTTYVDIMADIGHMIAGDDDLVSINRRIRLDEAPPEYPDAEAVQNVLDRIRHECAALGESFDERLSWAVNHVSHEEYETSRAP